MEELLRPYGFTDALQADGNLQAMAVDPDARRALARLLPDVLDAAGASADPDGALGRLERFVGAAGSASRTFSHLRADPRMTDVLLRSFGASPFLAEVLIRHPGWLYWLSEPGVLARARTARDVGPTSARPSRRWARSTTGGPPCASPSGARPCTRACATRCGSAASRETLLALSDAADALVEAALVVARDAGSPHGPRRLRGAGPGQARRPRAELQLRRRPRVRLRASEDAAAAEAPSRAVTRAWPQ